LQAGDGRISASVRQHAVQDRHANRTFILLGSEAACPQPRSDRRLVATYRRFDQRTLAIAGRRLPGQSSADGDRRQMPITMCGRSRFGAGTAVERDGITTLMPSPCAAIVW
jgi:hypothetical protein